MTLAHHAAQQLALVDASAETCIRQAENLMRNFRTERIQAQKRWFDEMQRRGVMRGSHSKGTWCPLALFARLHNGSLQIYWQLVFRDRATRSVGYKHLAKRRQGGYDLRTLLAHANDFERDLVAEYEEEARLQRQRWQALMSVRRALRQLEVANGKQGALMRRISGAETQEKT